jgi:glycosyltransferase involved in cell wall biosynthesis
MTLTIGHIVPSWLPRTETFTDALLRSMPDVRHRIFTTRTENLDLFPTADLVLARSEEEYPRLTAEHGVNLLFAHFGPSGVAALPAAIVNNLPLVTIFHGYDMSMVLRDPRWVARYAALFRFSAHGITVCEAGRRRLIDAGLPGDRITTIHLGVDPAAFAFRAPSPEIIESAATRLLMVARLTEKKGIHTALRALQRRRQAGGRETMTVIGGGELHGYLLALRGAFGLNDAVQFSGPRDLSHVRAAMHEHDVLLQPSITGTNGDCEGIPVVLMEAMASGLPVLSTRHSGIPELVVHEESGLLVDEGDDHGLASAIERLGRSPDLAGSLAANARARIESGFDVSKQAREYSGRLREIAASWPGLTSMRAARQLATGGTLFVRAAPVAHALAQMSALADRIGPQPLHLLTPADDAMERAGAVVAEVVHVLPAGRMLLAAIDPALLSSLRQCGYERVVIGCASGDLNLYDNVRTVAEALGAPTITAMLPNLTETSFGMVDEAAS